MRAEGEGASLLLLFPGSHCGLCGLGFSHALLELVHAAGRIDELLLAGVKGMAHVANADDDHRLGGASLNHIAARATDFRVHIFRMYINFHKRPGNIAPSPSVTRPKLEFFTTRAHIEKCMPRGSVSLSPRFVPI